MIDTFCRIVTVLVMLWLTIRTLYALDCWLDRRRVTKLMAAKRGMPRNPRYSPAGLKEFGPAHGGSKDGPTHWMPLPSPPEKTNG